MSKFGTVGRVRLRIIDRADVYGESGTPSSEGPAILGRGDAVGPRVGPLIGPCEGSTIGARSPLVDDPVTEESINGQSQYVRRIDIQMIRTSAMGQFEEDELGVEIIFTIRHGFLGEFAISSYQVPSNGGAVSHLRFYDRCDIFFVAAFVRDPQIHDDRTRYLSTGCVVVECYSFLQMTDQMNSGVGPRGCYHSPLTRC
jgi:hypothetical protein